MHTCSVVDEHEGTAPHLPVLSLHSATPMGGSSAVASPSSNGSHVSPVMNKKTSTLATLWLEEEHHTHEAFFTAGAAAITLQHTRCEEDREKCYDDEKHNVLYSDDPHEIGVKVEQGLALDSVAIGGASVTGSRAQGLIPLVPHESMSAVCNGSSSAAGVSAAVVETDGTGWRSDCRDHEEASKAYVGASADHCSYRRSTVETSAPTRAAHSTLSSPLRCPPGDPKTRLDILEEVEMCNLVPVLPRTFAVERLVQQLVPCTYAFGPQYPLPSNAACASSAEHAHDGANASSAGAAREQVSVSPIYTSTNGGCLAHLRRVSDQHLAFLRAVVSSPIMADAVSGTSAIDSEAAVEGSSVSRVCIALPSVPVYMQATSLAACGDSNDTTSIATHTTRSNGGEPKCVESGGNDKKELTPPTPPVVEAYASPMSPPTTNWSCNGGNVEVVLAHSAAVCRDAVTVSPESFRLEESPFGSGVDASVPREASDPVASVGAPIARGVGCAVASTCGFSPYRPLSEDNSGSMHHQPAPQEGSLAPPSSLASAVMESVDCLSREPDAACTSFAGAQARYTQYRRLLLQGHRGMEDVPTSRSTESFANTNLVLTDASQAQLEKQGDVPSRGAVAMPSPTEGFGTPDGALSTPATAAAPLAPYFRASGASTDAGVSAMAFTQTDARNAGDVLPLGGGFAFSSQPFGIPLSLHLAPSAPHDSYHQHHHHHEQQRQRQQSHLYVPPEWQGGALVEWSSGTVSYTSDTLGLYEEQQMRARRFYYLPPPPPTALLVAGVPVQGVANSHASVSSAAATEDRSNLRGAVLAQLQRFSRVRRAESALSHGAGASENKEAATPCVFDKRTTATATSVAVVGASRVAPRPLNLVKGQLSTAMSCSSSPTSPATMSVVSSPAHPCCCYRCLPLLVQFAQVPSVASPVLRRYLEVLHQRALPGFLVQQLRHGASMASTAVEVASAPSQEEVMKPASKQAPASITGTASARGGCHRRERSRTNRVRQRRGEEDDVTTTNGAKRSKKGSGYKNVTSPAAPCAPKTTGGGVQQWRSTDEALGVFPALQRWLTQRQEGGTATHGTPPSGQPARAGLVDAALPTDDVTQACSGASSEQLAQAETTSPRRHGRNCAPGASGARFSSSPHAETSGTDVGSLDWVDDAVLDEVVVVGVVPRGHPHELKLVVPSRAFCLALTQRLEEVAEAAVQILGFITPLHVALPSDVLVGVHGSPETVSAMHSTFSHDTTNTTTTTTHWRAWLEEEYFTSMWTTLRLRLTAVEWQSVLHDACRSPFLGRWAKCAAEGFGCGGTMLPGETLRTGVGRSAPRTHEWNAEGSPLETTQHVEEAIHNAVRDVQASVRSAAELHTSACLSAAEDLVTRVVLTALVPILHRRITVMYELLRHYASKSLYASHREQCDAYQHWYSMTPSPAAVLRLLQRSGRFGRALARCYPQYDLSPDRSFHPTTALDSGVRGETATPRHAAASRSFPSSPLSRAADKAGVSTDADSGTPKELQVSAPSLSKDEPSCYLNGFSATRAGDSQVRPRSCAGALAEVEDDESPPLSSSPTATTAPMAAASAWVSSPLSSCDEESLQGSSPQEQQPMILTYVPEAALLEPRYLQRFAWWMHRTHHSAGANSFGSAGSIINNNTSSAGVGAQQLSRVSNTVLSIPGDYLRVLPLQEQDPSIRTVLRSMAQKGRTLGLWEMRQHIRHRTSYVYH